MDEKELELYKLIGEMIKEKQRLLDENKALKEELKNNPCDFEPIGCHGLHLDEW